MSPRNNGSGKSRQQPAISTFFKTPQKRASSPVIDLTQDDDDGDLLPPSKRPRTSLAKQEASPGSDFAFDDDDDFPMELLDYPPSKASTSGPPNMSTSSAVTAERPQISKKVVVSDRSPVKKWQYHRRSATEVASPTTGDVVESETGQKNSRKMAFREKFLTKSTALEKQRSLQINEGGFSGGVSNEDGDSGGEMVEEAEEEEEESVTNFRRKHASTSKEKRKPDGKPAKGKGKKADEIGPSGQKYTPLEKQILQLKKDNPGVLLLVEVGYKYRFFGDDAKIASKELGIACWPDRNFLTASIPVHRRAVHIKKLISQGHKVGVVAQTETAALKKAGDNRSAPFDRKLTNLYTATTYVDELASLDDEENFGQGSSAPLLCLVEEPRGGLGADEKVLFGIVSVVPSTGDIVYDEFEDSQMRTELETRMTHLKPSELLLPMEKLSKATEKMLSFFTGDIAASHTIGRIRIERFENQMDYTEAFDYVSDFYGRKAKGVSGASEQYKSGVLMAAVVGFPQKVIIALAHTIKYLTGFGLADAFMQTTFFSKFLTRAHMLLNGNTLTNLEIYRNQTDYSEKGSLFWILNHTKTRFGARLLRSWIGKPLVNMELLRERVDAVEEVLKSRSHALDKIRILLRGLPDLVRGLCRIQYGKCTPRELATLLTAYQDVATAFEPMQDPSDASFVSSLLNSIVFSMPMLREPVTLLLSCINLRMAKDDEKAELWVDEAKYPAIQEAKEGIKAVEAELQAELKEVRLFLKRPTASWVSVSGIDYLIEVKNPDVKKVPAAWSRISSTKSVTRFHTPTVKSKIAERDQYKETLAAEADKAFLNFLREVNEHYGILRNVTNKLAIADCLMSLAAVANQSGYTKPIFVDEDELDISGGRHPMIEALRSDPFVPNTISIGGRNSRHKIITGPNMGGKSSCVRMIALIAIMAQIGSYVPATQAKLGLHGSILTRMGASDELARGRSTFMVEMSETCDIIKTATPRTLVILDELGRGTSTFDGMAIAHAVLQHLVETVACKTLFITHYPFLATELERYPEVANVHMGFIEETESDGHRSIHFLYRLSPGIARGSFGVECARLAGMPEDVLAGATKKAHEMKERVEGRREAIKAKTVLRDLKTCFSGKDIDGALAELKATMQLNE